VTQQDYEPQATEESASDLELWRRACTGEWEAFEALVSRYEPRVLRVTERILQQRHDAEDATQQTFINVMENLERFREESSLSTWILRIATNQALTMLRKRRTAKTVQMASGPADDPDNSPLPHPDFIAPWREDPAELAHQAEIKRLIDEALAEIPENYRVVFVLRDVEQFSTRETAEILGISESNVKVRLLRARLQLRERLTRVLGDESNRLYPSAHDH
jgi:RNA polymerase sigma-70 factor (ECF subfamily)